MSHTSPNVHRGLTPRGRVADIIRERLRARAVRDRRQKELFLKEDLWHTQIANKLEDLGLPMWEPIPEGWKRRFPWLDNFLSCGTAEILRQCCHCGNTTRHTINCSQKFCPRCQWRLTKRRAQMLTAWASRVKSPVHLVTTQKNFPVLTASKLRSHMRALARLRRHMSMRPVRGGAVSVEITNEGNGWHLHAHWLLDTGWLEAPEIARAWGKQVGQEYAIVKLKALRATDYIGECAKYLAKGNDVATWPAEQIWEFCHSIRGRRFFTTFGSLRAQADAVREQIAFAQPEKKPCECGSSHFHFKPDTTI